MSLTKLDIIRQSLDVVRDALRPYIVTAGQRIVKQELLNLINRQLDEGHQFPIGANDQYLLEHLDVLACLKIIAFEKEILRQFDKRQANLARTYAHELLEERHRWVGHTTEVTISDEDALRLVDTISRIVSLLSPDFREKTVKIQKALSSTISIENSKLSGKRNQQFTVADFEYHVQPIMNYLDSVKQLSLTEITPANIHKLMRVDALEGHTKSLRSIAFSPNANSLVSASSDGIRLWNLRDPKGSVKLSYHGHLVRISPDGKHLALGISEKVILVDTATFEQTGSLLGHQWWVTDLAFSPDGQLLASASEDSSISIWDVNSQSEIAIISQAREITSVDFSPNGRILAYSCEDGTVGLWDIRNDEQAGILYKDHGWDVTFNPDIGRKLLAFVAGTSTIRLWDIEGQREVAHLDAHSDLVNSLAFSADGQLLASASNDMTVKIWNLDNLTGPIFSLSLPDAVKTVAFSPNRRLIVCAGGRDGSEDMPSPIGDYRIHIWALPAQSMTNTQ